MIVNQRLWVAAVAIEGSLEVLIPAGGDLVGFD